MYSQFFIAASLLIASYQDIKERLVTDLVWIPALVGIGVIVVFTFGDVFTLAKIGLVALIALAFTKYGSIGEADLIALVVISADPYRLSPLPTLVLTSVFALSHAAYLAWKGYLGRSIQIPIERFKNEHRWIPKALISAGTRSELGRDVNTSREEALSGSDPEAVVEVSYGVPTVAYLGLGYLGYLLYLVVFDPSTFLALP